MLPIIKPLRGLMTNDDKQKPALYKIYGFTRGGTVAVDQKIQFYSVKTKIRKWTVIVFSYLIHTINLNCVILFAINKQLDPKKFKVFDYVFNLPEQLLVSQIKRNKGVDLLSNIFRMIEVVTGETDTSGEVAEPEKPEHCSACME